MNMKQAMQRMVQNVFARGGSSVSTNGKTHQEREAIDAAVAKEKARRAAQGK